MIVSKCLITWLPARCQTWNRRYRHLDHIVWQLTAALVTHYFIHITLINRWFKWILFTIAFQQFPRWSIAVITDNFIISSPRDTAGWNVAKCLITKKICVIEIVRRVSLGDSLIKSNIVHFVLSQFRARFFFPNEWTVREYLFIQNLRLF